MILLLFVDVQVRLCIGNIFLKYVMIYAGYFLSLYPILLLVVFAQKKRQYWDENLFHWRESINFGIKEPLKWIMAHQLINACNIPSGFSNFLILEIVQISLRGLNQVMHLKKKCLFWGVILLKSTVLLIYK